MAIPRKLHRQIHSKSRMKKLGKKDWNMQWEEHLKQGRVTSPAAAKSILDKMIKDYGLPSGTIYRYPR
jgi:hypothetical protein